MVIKKQIKNKIALTTLLFKISIILPAQINLDTSKYFNIENDILIGNHLKNREISDFILNGPSEKKFTKDSLNSKITFFNFWFEACTPCQAEFHALEKFYQNNKTKKEFQFISITYDPNDVIEKVRKKKGLTFPIYHLSRDSCAALILNTGYPTNLIVNRNKKIVSSFVGGSINPEEADKFINRKVQDELDKQF
jgi:thiol-disulfide isomerase/thioredoxin